MIGHHAPSSEVIALTIEMLNTIRYNFRNFWLLHPCISHSLIENFFNATAVKFRNRFSRRADFS